MGKERLEVLYLGNERGAEALIVGHARLPFQPITSGPVLERMAPAALWNLGKNLVGLRQAQEALKRFRPDVVFATGGFTSVPVVLAARLLHLPTFLFLPDLRPGLAFRFLSRWSTKIAVAFQQAKVYFPAEKTAVVGYPVRKELFTVPKVAAQRFFGLDPKDPVLLVFGGSRGSHSINMTLLPMVPQVLHRCQIIHICGEGDLDEAKRFNEGMTESMVSRYRPYDYLYDEMPYALIAADMALSRAGAATLGEFPAAGLPAILVPYPHAARHQYLNAQMLVEAGAALVIEDGNLSSDVLLETVTDLLDHPDKLYAMSENAKKLAKPDAATVLASHLLSLAGRESLKEGISDKSN